MFLSFSERREAPNAFQFENGALLKIVSQPAIHKMFHCDDKKKKKN